MIYLDNAATTHPKPPEVRQAMRRALERCGGAGRGGHAAARAASDVLFRCRETAAAFFGMRDPERVVFTHNATHALNLAIQSLSVPGKTTLLTSMEHNAVYRPALALQKRGVPLRVLHTPLFEPEVALHVFEEAVDESVGLVVCTHVSNVFGYVLPVERIAALCRQRGVPMIVDASQSAGHLPVRGDLYPYWCMPGHKGLYGPQGTGLLLVPPQGTLAPLLYGGTGGASQQPDMPELLPERLEAGTQNAHGIAGLEAGIRYTQARGGTNQTLLRQAVEALSYLRGLRVYSAPHLFCQSGLFSFTVTGMHSETVAQRLDEAGIAVRAGLHCAPLAHRTADTEAQGTVRVSFSHASSARDVNALVRTVKKL